MNSPWSLSWGDRTSVCDSQETVWSTRLNTRGSFVSIGHSATHIAASAQLPSRLQRASCIDCMLFQLLLALSARHGLFCDFCRHMSTHALRKIHFKKVNNNGCRVDWQEKLHHHHQLHFTLPEAQTMRWKNNRTYCSNWLTTKPKLMTLQFNDTAKTKISVIDVGRSVNPESNSRLLNTFAEKDSREQ